MPEKSAGHLFFVRTPALEDQEYFTRGTDVFRAPVSNVIMPDGRRTGRFECATNTLNLLVKLLEGGPGEIIRP